VTISAKIRSGVPRGPLGPAAAVTAAGFGANLLSYAVLLVAVHALASSSYGQLVVLLNVLLVGTVPSFAIQSVTARRVATNETAGTARATAIIAVAAAGTIAVLAPALSAFLHMSGSGDLLLVAAAVPAVTALGMYQGILQGQHRFTELGAVLGVAAVGRSGCGLIGLALGRNSTATLLAILVGVSACAGLVGSRLRGRLTPGPAAGPLREMAHAIHAHGTFWFLSTLDLLLARHVLSSHVAAIYATGSVVTRAAIWLPQSVASLVFPHLTDAQRHARMFRRAVAVVAGAGLIAVAGTAALPSLVAKVVGGGRYPELVPSCWLFATLGASLALLQLSMIAGLALRRTRQTIVLWAAMVADTVLVLAGGSQDTVRPVIGAVTLVTALAATASVLIGTGWLARRQLAEASGQAVGT
jgi:O-antigen/teichoic acid export membrane protein